MYSKDQAISIISGARGCSWNDGKVYYDSRKRDNLPLVLPGELECYKEKYGNYGRLETRK